MGRRRSSRTIQKRWLEIDFELCAECNNPLALLTNSKHEDAFYNGDIVRCTANCGATGHFNIPANAVTGSILWDNIPPILIS